MSAKRYHKTKPDGERGEAIVWVLVLFAGLAAVGVALNSRIETNALLVKRASLIRDLDNIRIILSRKVDCGRTRAKMTVYGPGPYTYSSGGCMGPSVGAFRDVNDVPLGESTSWPNVWKMGGWHIRASCYSGHIMADLALFDGTNPQPIPFDNGPIYKDGQPILTRLSNGWYQIKVPEYKEKKDEKICPAVGKMWASIKRPCEGVWTSPNDNKGYYIPDDLKERGPFTIGVADLNRNLTDNCPSEFFDGASVYYRYDGVVTCPTGYRAYFGGAHCSYSGRYYDAPTNSYLPDPDYHREGHLIKSEKLGDDKWAVSCCVKGDAYPVAPTLCGHAMVTCNKMGN